MEWNNVFFFVSFHVSISYMNELMSCTSKTFREFVFFLYCCRLRRFIIVTHCIISLLPFGKQLTYEHVVSNQPSCEYVDIVQKIVNKGTNVNAKGENG